MTYGFYKWKMKGSSITLVRDGLETQYLSNLIIYCEAQRPVNGIAMLKECTFNF
jgi:hypothetical protein